MRRTAAVPRPSTRPSRCAATSSLAGLVPLINRIDAQLPNLATTAEVAKLPTRGYLWGVMTAMVGAQAVALAAAGLIFAVIQARPAAVPPRVPPSKAAAFVLTADQPPYPCRLLYDEQRKCAFGACDARALDRLKRECLRDGGRP